MFYAGGYNNEPQQIGCAVSTDGIRWKRLSKKPFLPNGAPGSWNASESGHPGVFVDKDGHLKIIDRAKDVGRLRDGTLFAPKYIENKLKFFSYVKEAVAFGHGRDYASCILCIDLDAVGNWAERKGIAYASYQELAAKPEVQKMVTMTPYQADVSGRAPKLEAPKATIAARAPNTHGDIDAVAEPEVDEPKKRESKKAETPAPTAKKNLDSVVAAWTDEE
jgi:long-subunit acyl-CoA synthetase (AMP-forming)